jgi:hypothetical protein
MDACLADNLKQKPDHAVAKFTQIGSIDGSSRESARTGADFQSILDCGVAALAVRAVPCQGSPAAELERQIGIKALKIKKQKL